MKQQRPIGVFDSGLGGLTVLKEMNKVLPAENIIYFGDTARVPYGTKSQDTIIKFTTNNILFLLRKKVKFIVVACNTSSSLALDYLKEIFMVPLIGVIDAGVEKAFAVSGSKRIGVIGTKSTINSGSYQQKLKNKDGQVQVLSQACPLFVPLVEEGLDSGPIVDAIIEMYLSSLKNNVDSLILGCTHYPLLKQAIGRYLQGTYLVDSAKEIALTTKALLKRKNLLNDSNASGERDFFVTDRANEFMSLAKIFLDDNIKKPKVVNV
jgi:glutamate racemase